MEKNDSQQARGLRNNNPLNIRKSSNNWLGKVTQNTDGCFEQFTTIEYGLRAAFLNIRTIVRRRQAQNMTTTVAQLVRVWAPASDGNNEAAYCRTIFEKSEIPSSTEIDIANKDFMCRLIQAMCWVEVGSEVPLQTIGIAYNLAFNS